MNWLNQKPNAVLLRTCVFFLLLFAGAGLDYASDVEVEIWELKLTGDTEGVFIMQVKRVNKEKGRTEISGKFSGSMNDLIFGRGEMLCRLKGKIENEAFEGKINGFAEVTMGMVSLSGTLRGTVLESSGVGSWKIIHDMGLPEGKWVIKKIFPSQ